MAGPHPRFNTSHCSREFQQLLCRISRLGRIPASRSHAPLGSDKCLELFCVDFHVLTKKVYAHGTSFSAKHPTSCTHRHIPSALKRSDRSLAGIGSLRLCAFFLTQGPVLHLTGCHICHSQVGWVIKVRFHSMAHAHELGADELGNPDSMADFDGAEKHLSICQCEDLQFRVSQNVSGFLTLWKSLLALLLFTAILHRSLCPPPPVSLQTPHGCTEPQKPRVRRPNRRPTRRLGHSKAAAASSALEHLGRGGGIGHSE